MSAGIKHIDGYQRVVDMVCPDHNAARVLHFKRDERIAGCNTRSQKIAMRFLCQLLIDFRKREQARIEAFFHHKIRTANLHALTFDTLFQSIELVIEFLLCICHDSDEH